VREKPLFLHLLAPRAYTDPPMPAHRILTARVYPFQDFSISVGMAGLFGEYGSHYRRIPTVAHSSGRSRTAVSKSRTSWIGRVRSWTSGCRALVLDHTDRTNENRKGEDAGG
jgi:hypothetical protein